MLARKAFCNTILALRPAQVGPARRAGRIAFVAAAICSAATLSFAETIEGDVTISDVNRVLSEDLTINGILKMSLGGFIDLNGHTLTAHGVTEDPNDVFPASFDSSGAVDLTRPGGAVESNSSASYPASVLFDNSMTWSSSHRILFSNITSSNPFWVIYDFGEGVQRIVTRYRVYFGCTGGQYVKRAPKDFTLEGSNDKGTWTTLHTRTGENWGSTWTDKAVQGKTYTCSSTGAYRYYRFKCTAAQNATDYLEVVQLELLANQPRITSGESGTASDMTTPSGSVSSSSVNGGSAKALFDNNTTRSDTERMLFYNPTTSNPFWVTYDFGAGVKRIVTSYRIYVANVGGQYINRKPKDWTFAGSDDNVTWTTVHSVSGQTWNNSSSAENKTFTVSTPGAYRYYKLTCTATIDTASAKYIELVELEYFGNTSGEGTLVLDTPAGDFITNKYVKVKSGLSIEKRGEGTFANRLQFSNSGDTTVSGGVFALGVNNAITTSTGVTVGSDGTLDLGGHSQTIKRLSGCGTVSNGTLTVTGEINPGMNAATPGVLTFADVALSGPLVLDASAAGLDGISVVSGEFDLSGLALNVSNFQALPTGKYTLVSSVDGLTGDFSSVPTIPRKWKLRRTSTAITLGGRGVMIVIK